MSIRVLVVEDEEIAAAAHAEYVRRVDGFDVAGVARSGVEALRLLAQQTAAGTPVDLVLLDMHLPDGHGLDLVRSMRQRGWLCDVIAVTSARDVEVVRRAVAQGVVQYVLKPFTFAGLRTRLEQYAAFREQLGARAGEVGQAEVDELFTLLRTPSGAEGLPKGLSEGTLRLVSEQLRAAADALSATSVAEALGTSRVTARRYLEYLADSGLVERRSRYGRTGRPEVEYRWRTRG
jgi:response regulator of citrate/malate metabolism